MRGSGRKWTNHSVPGSPNATVADHERNAGADQIARGDRPVVSALPSTPLLVFPVSKTMLLSTQ